MTPKTTRRETLLDATAEIVRESGYSALTLEAVAARAGVSKGGLLYHFPTKEALVEGLLERLTADFEAGHAQAYSADLVDPGRWTRAYVRASLSAEGASDHDDVASALIAGLAMNPAMLDPLRDRYAIWSSALDDDGLAGVDAQLVRMATDGIWLADLIGLAPVRGAQRDALVARLIELAGGEE
jgi:AcrR family transcriptional regulator